MSVHASGFLQRRPHTGRGENVLVEEDPRSHDELEDVLQSLHGFQQLVCQLLCVVHVVLQYLRQFPESTRMHDKLTHAKPRVSHPRFYYHYAVNLAVPAGVPIKRSFVI